MDHKQWQVFRETNRADLKARLDRTLPRGLRAGAWTPREVLHHVLLTDDANVRLLERLAEKAKAKALLPRLAGSPWAFRAELLDFPLDTAFSVPAFPGTEPKPKVTDRELSALETGSWGRLADLAAWADSTAVDVVFPHPLAGKLNFYEWLVFGPIHEGLHLRQLNTDLGGA